MGRDIRKELNRAIETEVEGFSFYNLASELVKDERGKAVLRQLAKDELDHIRALISLGEHLSHGGEWPSYRDAVKLGRGIGGERLPVFPSMEEVRGWLSDNPGDEEILRFGIDVERKAIEYYSRALEEASSDREKDFFSTMVEVEEGHRKLLEWEHDYLVRSGFWCDHREFTVEGER